MFAQSMTEDEVNKHGSSSDIRFFATTYGEQFGYNERARKYHRSYGLVTPPTNEAFQNYRLGDLATAPLFRRDHLGFRQDYADAEFTWSASAAKLKKNQKTYGEEQQPQTSVQLPQRRVVFRASHFPSTRADHDSEREAEEAAHAAGRRAYFEQQASEAQRRQQQQYAHEEALRNAPPSSASPSRPNLTSSLSPLRLAGQSLSSTGRNPMLSPQDHLNPHLYPTAALKASPYNPQFNVRK